MLSRTALILKRAREVMNNEELIVGTELQEEGTHEASLPPKIYTDLQPLQDIHIVGGYVDTENEISGIKIMDYDLLINEKDKQLDKHEYLEYQIVEQSSDKDTQNIIEESNYVLEVDQSDGENDEVEAEEENNGVKSEEEGNEVDSKEEIYQGRPKKGRKRKFPSQNRHTRKENCIHNKAYYTQRGNIRLTKEFRQYLCKCSCLSKVGVENARGEYEKFYKVSSHDAQRALICAMVREGPIKRKRVKNSFSKYKNVFLTHFNLKRKPLKKDTCNLCDKLEILISTCTTEEQDRYKTERDNHRDSAEEARQTLNADRKRAKYDKQLKVLCFDMEKTLPLPRIPTNVIFYKRQLWLYNLGIHTAKNNQGHCYVWLFCEAGRWAQEVGSCLFRHVMEDRNMVGCKHLILWSDSCGGQNRNIKVVLMLNALFDAHPLLEKITLRFLTSGHSFLPNDADFGDIECALKLQQRIYSPVDYMNVMSMCRKKNPLVVHKMEKEHFFSTANLEKKIVNRKVDVSNNKINWLKFKEIEIRKESREKIFVKYSFHEEAREINLEKKRGRPSQESSKNFRKSFTLLWPNGKPISDKKLDDLKFLLSLIPKDAKDFYKKLTGDPNIEEDIEGFNGQLDFELEDE